MHKDGAKGITKASTLSVYFGINTGTRLQPPWCFKLSKLWNLTRFKEYWPQIYQAGYCTALEDESLEAVIAPWKDSVIAFVVSQLKEFQSIDDYQELLKLTIKFLGGIPPRGIHFQYPSAVHHARWVARAIYSLKMVPFWRQYNFQKQQQVSQRVSSASYEPLRFGITWSQSVCCYSYLCEILVSMSICNRSSKEWSTCRPSPWVVLVSRERCGQSSYHSFDRHLWYLSEHLISFAFFDEKVGYRK